MNPLAPLPASNSQQFSLNKLDWKKLGRAALVQVAGLAVTLVIPALLNFKYVIKGVDLTPGVVVGVGWLGEMLRRFVASNGQ